MAILAPPDHAPRGPASQRSPNFVFCASLFVLTVPTNGPGELALSGNTSNGEGAATPLTWKAGRLLQPPLKLAASFLALPVRFDSFGECAARTSLCHARLGLGRRRPLGSSLLSSSLVVSFIIQNDSRWVLASYDSEL